MAKDVVIEGVCDCGAEVRTVIPGDAAAFVLRIAKVQRARGVVQCSACGEAEELRDGPRSVTADSPMAEELRRRKSAIPSELAGVRFEDVEVTAERERAIELARGWAAGEFAGLVLWGGVGRGKTRIAAAAVNAMLGRRTVRWVPVAKELMGLRMPFSSPEYLRSARRFDSEGASQALALDDVDKSKPTEHAFQPVYAAVDAWMNMGLPLIVTLNHSPDELRDWLPDTFGEPLASRLSGYCKIREVGGRDWREDGPTV